MADHLETVTSVAAVLCSAAAIVASLVALVSTRQPQLALSTFLDFLLAAGLLRLAGSLTWRSLATAAAVVVIRRLVTSSLRRGGRSWREAGAKRETSSSRSAGCGPAASSFCP